MPAGRGRIVHQASNSAPHLFFGLRRRAQSADLRTLRHRDRNVHRSLRCRARRGRPLIAGLGSAQSKSNISHSTRACENRVSNIVIGGEYSALLSPILRLGPPYAFSTEISAACPRLLKAAASYRRKTIQALQDTMQNHTRRSGSYDVQRCASHACPALLH